ncbi:MAG: hypothetical protein WCZ21_06945 [Bacteroidales bacterium]|jgi:hypothetical protein
MKEQEFIKAGFTVVGTENNESKLFLFLKNNYPNGQSEQLLRYQFFNVLEFHSPFVLPILTCFRHTYPFPYYSEG